jgi:DNA-binding GntR family transcriptional regulator
MVFEWLIEQIAIGALRPGELLSENEIADRLGVSRTPVREALQGFAREGLVNVLPRRGTVIAYPSPSAADDLYQARKLNDGELARLAILEMDDDDLVQLAAILEGMRGSAGDAIAFFRGMMSWWQWMVDLCPNMTLREIVVMLWRRSIPYRGTLVARPEQQANAIAAFADFYEHAQARDARRAAEVIVELAEAARQWIRSEFFIDAGVGPSLARSVVVPGS